MGIWVDELFTIHAACDWAFELVESDNLAGIERAFDVVLNARNCYDISHDYVAMAAIEVLAILLGKEIGFDWFPEELAQWIVDNRRCPSTELLKKATRCVYRFSFGSAYVLDMREYSDGVTEWQSCKVQFMKAVGA